MAYNIELGDYKVGLNIGWNENGVKIGENKWVVTAFDNSKMQSEKQGSNSASFTKGETLPLNSSDIIPQTTQAKQSGKSVKETKELLQKNEELQSRIKEFEKKLYESDKLARKMEYTSDSSGLSTKSYSHNENLERYFKDKFIDVDDFLTLKKLDKKSGEYKALLEKMYYKQQEQKANVKALGDLDSNVVAEQSQDYMQNYIKQIHNMSEQELINERKKLLTMPLHNDNMRLMNAQMQEALESFMYPNMKYFTQNPTIYTFLRNGEIFDKRNGAKKLSLQEFDTYRKMLEEDLNLTPIKEFGANYIEYYRDGVGAIQKLISEAKAHKQSGAKGEYKGQVAGAFYRKELGDIDLVWGEVQGSGKEAKGWGLAKIIEKHLNAGDFKAFGEGEAGLINAMSEIIDKGKVITQNGVSTIWYKKDENIYKLGISKGFHKKGDNNWIITSYKAEREKDKTFGDALFTDKHPLPNSTNIIPQPTQKSLFDTQEATLPKVDSSEAPPSKINFTYTTGEAKGIAELRKDLKAALEPYKSTPITNKETGLQGVVTIDTERNKISSKKAVDKSIANGFTRDEHFAAAQDLKNLFENATKAQSHNDYKQRENIAQVHRFVKDLYINDKPAQAKITLFEKIEGKNRIYTLELESLSKPDSPKRQRALHKQE